MTVDMCASYIKFQTMGSSLDRGKVPPQAEIEPNRKRARTYSHR